MKITILNGNMQGEAPEFTEFIEQLEIQLRLEHQIEHFPLAEMNLKYCTGCWTCWWKTPGVCALHDDAEILFRSIIQSDLLIFASPLKAGFTTSLLKKINDRFVVLVHPYVQLIHKECHHLKRYDKYPNIGLILSSEADTDARDLKIVNDIYDRFALNFHSRRLFTHLIENTQPKELAHEISHI